MLLMRVALYTLSIGDNCCRNLVLHVCLILYRHICITGKITAPMALVTSVDQDLVNLQ